MSVLWTLNVFFCVGVYALKIIVICMFIVTPDAFVFLTGQGQKKGLSHITEKGQITLMKDDPIVNLCPSTPSVTNVLSAVEGLPLGARFQNCGKSEPPRV